MTVWGILVVMSVLQVTKLSPKYIIETDKMEGFAKIVKGYKFYSYSKI